MVLQRITGTAALEELLSILPMDIFIEQEVTITALRLKITNCWHDESFGHANILTAYSKKIPEFQMPTERCLPQYFFTKIVISKNKGNRISDK